MEKIKAAGGVSGNWKHAAWIAISLTCVYLALALGAICLSIFLSSFIRWNGWEWSIVLVELPGYLILNAWCVAHGNTSQVIFCSDEWLLLPIEITLVVVFVISFFSLLVFYKKKR